MKKKRKLSKSIIDSEDSDETLSSGSEEVCKRKDNISSSSSCDEEGGEKDETTVLNHKLDKILSLKKNGPKPPVNSNTKVEQGEDEAEEEGFEDEEDGDEEENEDYGITGEERFAKLIAEACRDGSVVMVSALNLLDFIRKNYPYVLLKLENVISPYNITSCGSLEKSSTPW